MRKWPRPPLSRLALRELDRASRRRQRHCELVVVTTRYPTLGRVRLFCVRREASEGIQAFSALLKVLYYWLRTATLTADVREDAFQTLERNWTDVVASVESFVERAAAS